MSTRRSSSAWTGKAPRTCQEAFGPYTSFGLHHPGQRSGARPWLILALVWVILFALLGWAPR